MDGIMMNIADAVTLALCLTFIGTLALAVVYAMRMLGVG
jgi:hypothetical protein